MIQSLISESGRINRKKNKKNLKWQRRVRLENEPEVCTRIRTQLQHYLCLCCENKPQL